jgi:glucose/arabinose dehydrogenase
MNIQKTMLLLITFLFISLDLCGQKPDETIQTPVKIDYKTETVIAMEGIPWGMEFLSNNQILVSEISGQLILFKDGKQIIIENTPEVYRRGQGGLMDIALHPNYNKNGWIYISYSSSEGDGKGGNTSIIRGKIDNNTWVNQEVIYKAGPNTTKPYHFGCRMVFDDEGHLFFGIGDRGEHFENPQDITKDGGKVYRINDDGSIPEDNPFYHVDEARKAVFSFGHRNPQGLAKHPFTRQIWENEHGPQGGDEINIIKKGKNYGWPVISYGINYDGSILTDKTEMEGMEQPFYYYIPSIAPSCMAFLDSDKYPDWKNNLLIGSLKFQYLERLIIDNNKVIYREKLLENIGRVRNVKIAPDGLIYVGVEGKGIIKIIPNK